MTIRIYRQPARCDTIDIPIYAMENSNAVSVAGRTSFRLPLTLDSNIVSVVGFVPAIPNLALLHWDTVHGNFIAQLMSNAGFVLTGEQTIGYIRCIVWLGEERTTSISIASNVVTGGGECLSLETNEGSLAIELIGCGDSTLARFMQTDRLRFAIQAITPNPTSTRVSAQFVNSLHGEIAYELVDALGTVRMHGATSEEQLLFDATNLPSGVYQFRAMSAGVVATKSVCIIR